MKHSKKFKTVSTVMCMSMLSTMLLVAPASAASLYSDNFEDGNSTGWSTQYGAWSVVQSSGSQVFQQSSTSEEGRASAGSQTWKDYSVEADVNVANFNGSNRVMVAGRYKDGNNYYAASLFNSSGGTLEIRKKVGGSSSTLKSKALPLAANTSYKVKLEVNGSTIHVYVNGTLQLTATDSSLTAGGIGLIAAKASARFDNVQVSDSASTPTDPTPTDPTPTDPTPTNPTASVLYVSPTGTDASAGTIDAPTTLTSAVTRLAPGGTIYMRGGTYAYSTAVMVARGNNGSAAAKKAIVAYGSEKPVLDFSSQPYNASDASLNARGLTLGGNYWVVKGLEVKGAADNGIFISGNYNRVENVDVHHNRDSGVQISRYASSASQSEWPSYNEVVNVYSHDNFDPDNGEDADGFAAKLTIGPGNVFDGCVAAYNTDDGWDLYTKTETGPIGAVTIKNSIAHHNGQTSDGNTTANSDGNGYKLGGEKIKVDHIVINSVAYQNKKHGFTYNSNPGSIQLTNNTSYSNGQSNFAFDLGTHIFTNNLSYKGSSSDKTSGTDVSSTNVWWKSNASTNAKGLVASDADFVSLMPSLTRAANGAPNLGNFLKLATGSDLIGSGTPSGKNIGASITGSN